MPPISNLQGRAGISVRFNINGSLLTTGCIASPTASWDMASCPAWLDFATHKCPAWLGGVGCEEPTQEEVNAICAEWSGLSIGVDQLETAGYNTPCFHATAAGPGEVQWAMFCGGRYPEWTSLSAEDCLAWGYSSERCGEMDCLQCMGGQCDWGNYFDVISAQPTDYGFKGLWTSAAWIDAPHDLDAVRMSAGCTVEVATESNGGGQSYTFTGDVRVCGNEVGCDRIRSIRVFKQGAIDVDSAHPPPPPPPPLHILTVRAILLRDMHECHRYQTCCKIIAHTTCVARRADVACLTAEKLCALMLYLCALSFSLCRNGSPLRPAAGHHRLL